MFLKIAPCAKSIKMQGSSSYLFLKQGDQSEQHQAALQEFASLFPHLQHLKTVYMCCSESFFSAVLRSMHQCSALTELSIDVPSEVNPMRRQTMPDALEAMASPVVTLQTFRLSVELDLLRVLGLDPRVAGLGGYSSLTSLSLHFSMRRQVHGSEGNESIGTEGMLSVLGEVLQPLKLLRHLRVDTKGLCFTQWRQCTQHEVASFIALLEQLDVFDVDGSLMCMLLPVVPRVGVVQSLRFSEADIRKVCDAQGVQNLKVSALSMLTELTNLFLEDYDDVVSRLADVLKFLPDLRAYNFGSGTIDDFESWSTLPDVAALSKMETFSYVLCCGQKNFVGWKQFARAETLLMSDSLTHLTLDSENSGHGFPGLVSTKDIPQFYAVLARLTSLKELNVYALPHSASFLTCLATLKDLEQLSLEAVDPKFGKWRRWGVR